MIRIRKEGWPSLAHTALVLACLLSSVNAGQQAPRQRGGNPPLQRPEVKTKPVGNVDMGRSRVYIFVGKTGFGHDHGVEGRLKSGDVKLGAAERAGSLVFDMRTFNADTPTARRYVGLKGTTDASTRSQVNTNMKGSAVLNVRRFPTATFKILSAKATKRKSRRGHPMYQLSGDFTLHGVTRRIAFNAEAVPEKTGTRLRGNFVVRQTQFGITPYSKAFGAVGVADALRIYGDIVLKKATTAPEKSGSVATGGQTKGARQ